MGLGLTLCTMGQHVRAKFTVHAQLEPKFYVKKGS